MNNEFIDNVIASLKIIGMLQKNQKLCVRKGQLTIERDDRMQFMRRWINNDSRDTIIMHIRNTANNAFKIAQHMIEMRNTSSESGISEWTLNLIMNELENARNGLVNLKTTYVNDAIMIANLDVLVDRISINCNDISSIINVSQSNVNTNGESATSILDKK